MIGGQRQIVRNTHEPPFLTLLAWSMSTNLIVSCFSQNGTTRSLE